MEIETKSQVFLRSLAKEYQRNGFNIKQAYKKIRPKVKDNTAEVEGSKVLRKPMFQAFLGELKGKANKTYGIDMQKLVKDLENIKKMGIKPTTYFNTNGEECEGKPSDLNASLKAVDTLIKIIGGYAPTKIEQDVSLSIVDVLNAQEAENSIEL